METGSSIRTAVLDVSRIERLVDLSLKPAFVNKSKKETTNGQAQKVFFEFAISSLCCTIHSLGLFASLKRFFEEKVVPSCFHTLLIL